MKKDMHPRIKKILVCAETKIGCLCLLLFVILQNVRHCYFLTDDNLTGWLPGMVELGRSLFEGKDPFFNEYLYGGVSLTQDAGVLSVLNPLTLLISILSVTRFYFWMADALAFFHLFLGAVFFYRMSRFIRKKWNLPLGTGQSLFLSLSWAFSAYNLSVGASWINFLGNMAALPLLFWGVLHPNPKTSGWLILAGASYSLFCGHLHAFLYSAAILTVVAAAVSFHEKRPAIFLRWVGIHMAVLIIAFPVLLPGFMNVMHSVRPVAVTSENSSACNMPVLITVASMFVGPMTLISMAPVEFFRLAPAWCAGLGFSAASICFLFALFQGCLKKIKTLLLISGLTLISLIFFPQPATLILMPFFLFFLMSSWSVLRSPERDFYEKLAIAMILGLLLLIHRSDMLSRIIDVIPVYRMLHWPFREILQLVFFLHIFLCFRIGNFSERALQRCGFLGIVLMVSLPILGLGGGSLNPMEMDRNLVISRTAEAWWEGNGSIDNGERWLPVIERGDADELIYDTPFSLLGAYNYPALYRVKSQVGYWGSWIPLQNKLDGVEPYHWSGILTPEDLKHLLKTGKFQYVRAKVLNGGKDIELEAVGGKGTRTLIIPRNFAP